MRFFFAWGGIRNPLNPPFKKGVKNKDEIIFLGIKKRKGFN